MSFSDNDKKWKEFNNRLMEAAIKMNWALYTMVRFEMGEFLKKEGKLENAIEVYLEVLYLDQNGPSDCEHKKDNPDLLRDFPPFDLGLSFIASGIIDKVRILVKKLKIDIDEIKRVFLRHNQKIHESLKTPLSPEKAWEKIGPEIKLAISKNKK